MQRTAPLAELDAIFFHTQVRSLACVHTRTDQGARAPHACMGVVSIPSLYKHRSLFSTHISAITPISTDAYKPVCTVTAWNSTVSWKMVIHELPHPAVTAQLLTLILALISAQQLFPVYCCQTVNTSALKLGHEPY